MRLRKFRQHLATRGTQHGMEDRAMHGIIYLVGLIVVVMALLSFVGLR